MKIAIVQAPMWGVDVPSLGLATLSAWLRKNGFKVKVFDLNIEFYNSSFAIQKFYNHRYNDNWDKEYLFKKIKIIDQSIIDAWVERILLKKPEMVCFPIFLTTRQVSLRLAEGIKKAYPKTFIVFGGPDCVKGRNYDQISTSGVVDAIVFGEGELTILELARNIENKIIKKVDGCVIFTKNKIIQGDNRELIKDLNVLPKADYSDFQLDKYTVKNNFAMMMSRGCPMKCPYCSEGEYWKVSRTRDAEHVFDEMKHLFETHGARYFHFGDCMINANIKEVSKLCDLLIGSKLDINWKVKAYPDKRFDHGFMKKMRDAGCVSWELGIESGSNRVIKEMGRHYDIETVKKILQIGKDVGIDINTFWMVGYPTESEEDFEKTLTFLNEIKDLIKIDPSSVSMFQLLPDTPFYSEIDKFGVELDPIGLDWQTKDKNNTIDIRMDRYRRFNNCAKNLDLFNKEAHINV